MYNTKLTINNNFFRFSLIFSLVTFTISTTQAQIQTLVGVQQVFSFGPTIGPSVGLILKDKLLLNYGLAINRQNSGDFFSNGFFTETDYYFSFLSTGWIFTKPYKNIRMGSGLSILILHEVDRSYLNNYLTDEYSSTDILRIPIPFFYLDCKLAPKIKLTLNTNILINNIGLGYRFGSPAVKPTAESKIKRVNKGNKVILH